MRFEALGNDARIGTLAERLKEPGGVVSASGWWGSFAPLLACLLWKRLCVPVVYVTAHVEQADNVRDDLEFFAEQTPELLPPWETVPGEGEVRDEIAAERVTVCSTLEDGRETAGGAPSLLVAPIQALMQPVPAPAALGAQSLQLRLGQQHSLDRLADWLVGHGFERLDLVESPGDFAIRGGILDVFPTGGADPVRVEFFGEQIESIRRFDVSSQRSSQTLSAVRVPALKQPSQRAGDETVPLFAYLPPQSVVVFEEPAEIQEIGRTLWTRLGEPPGMYSTETVFQQAGALAQLHLGRFGGTPGTETVHFDIQSVERFDTQPSEAIRELCRLAETDRAVVVCDTQAEQQRFVELVEAVLSPADGVPGSVPASLELSVGLIHRGFRWVSAGLAVVGHHEIFHRYRQRRRIRRAVAARAIESWLELDQDDYVVHTAHGIGRFAGIATRRKEGTGTTEEYLTLEFADGATLHVPATQIDRVQKYVGAGGVRPQLSKLGGTRWRNTTRRVAEAVDDLAGDLLRIQATRNSCDGVAYPHDTPWQREFEGSFIYTETEDQIQAGDQIKGDMTQPRPMDRLLCGDVGYGKTELAMRAAFKAVEYGKQVAVLVPTTVLCEQHARTFRERLADYPFVVESVNRFKSRAAQADILRRARKGQVDILIGTHRLLSSDVAFADLGLVIIDEEQRFGVEHKERLKKMRESVDVLTMSATPIPRTLHMSMLGIRDISSLATPPLDRRSIVTRISQFEPSLIREAIIREMNRDGQVYFVHNYVQDIRSVADDVRRVVPECRVVVAHGQMNEHELEEVMLRFVRHEADVLVCTTIIESGIDIPNVNTIFINNVERFGLADLHQLRGRVGRYKHRAYCYLLLSPRRPLSAKAGKRLKTIEEFSELGAGFRIAMRDLEIRGAGNMLGPEQSGHIAAVGYEMYCRLLDAAVRRMSSQPPARPEPVHLELEAVAHIPKRYIKSDRLRMEAYRRLADCRTPEDVKQLQADLGDAFGPYPRELQTLLDLAEIRVLAVPWRIRSIIIQRPDVVFSVEDLKLAEALFDGAAGTARRPDPKTIHWRPPSAYLERPTLLAVLRRLLQRPVPADMLSRK